MKAPRAAPPRPGPPRPPRPPLPPRKSPLPCPFVRSLDCEGVSVFLSFFRWTEPHCSARPVRRSMTCCLPKILAVSYIPSAIHVAAVDESPLTSVNSDCRSVHKMFSAYSYDMITIILPSSDHDGNISCSCLDCSRYFSGAPFEAG